MYIFLFVFSLFVVNSYSSLYKTHKRRNGYDHRYESVTDSSPLMSRTIADFFKKKRILDMLENPLTPLHVKTRSLTNKNMDIRPLNIRAGGLLKDWTFDMEEPVNGK